MGTLTLTGIGWDHARCRGPMLAAAERWARLRPGVRVEWQFRSLAAFNDEPLEGLAARSDLLVIDHPFVGTAAATGCLAPLDSLVPPAQLGALAADAVGPSHASYAYAGRQWAFAVDAACQVGAVRDDLLGDGVRRLPRDWAEVAALADGLPGRVAIPLYPTDAICTLLTLCASLGAPAGLGPAFFADAAAGERALAVLADLLPRLHRRSLELNPPGAFDHMRDTDEIAFVPVAFGYASYSRRDASGSRIRFLDVPAFPGHPPRALLGGAGIGVSAACSEPEVAAELAAWVSGAEAQRQVVFAAGGQPGSRAAWCDPVLDAAAGGFFAATRSTIEAAWVRPRESWWPAFQKLAGEIVHEFLREGAEPAACARELEQAFAAHRTGVAVG